MLYGAWCAGFDFILILTPRSICRYASKALAALDLQQVICGHPWSRILTFGRHV